MKKKNRMLVLPALLTLSFAGIASGSLRSTPRMLGGPVLQEEYKLNTLFTVPTLEKDGLTYECTIEFPNGESYYQSEVRLSEVGVYKLHYTAEKDGKFYSEEYSFLVKTPYVAFDGSKSISSYEKSERTYNKQGLYVSLAEGETMTFNTPIDISKDGEILDMFVAPSIAGSADFTELYITLTEVEDPSNVMTVRAKASPEGSGAPYTYWAAKGPGQDLTGYEASFGNIHVNNDFGCPVIHSFYGQYKPTYSHISVGGATLNLNYKKTENAVYASSALIVDFDDSKFFSSLWDGFQTNLVTMSLYARGYSGTYANFVINRAIGQDLTLDTIEDNEAPEITVDIPGGKVATAKKGTKYKVYSASAKDNMDGDVKVSARAILNYGSGRESILPIVDGCFDIPYEGNYAIVYEASDRMGNVSQKVVRITTTETIEEIKIAAKADIQKEIKQGLLYAFPEYEMTGGSGALTGTFHVTKDGKEYPIEKTYFIPKEKGDYSITYTATDYLGESKEETYTLSVKENDGAVLYEDITLPSYYIADAAYTLPEVVCYDYSSGSAVAVDMPVTIKNSYFEYEATAGETFVPKIEGSQEDLTFTFHYKNIEVTKTALTVNPYKRIGGIDRFAIENYLLGENATFDVGDNDIGIVAKSEGNASFTFVNSILAEGSSITFTNDPDHNEYDSLKVCFVDSENEDEAVTLSVSKNGEKTSFKIDSRTYTADMNLNTAATLSFAYSDGRFSFGNMGIQAKIYDNGKAFKGFSSSKVYLKASLSGAKKDAAVRLASIDNQSMSYASSDYGKPRIVIDGDYGGIFNINGKGKVNRIYASDTLDPNSICSVTVHSPEGEIVKSDDGILLEDAPSNREYMIDLTSFGQYIVTYSAKDTSDNQTTFIFAMNVEDNEAPVIALTSEMPKTVKVGENLRVPSYSVKDNYDEKVSVALFVVTSHGESIYLDKHNAFKPQFEGTYTLRIRAMDSAGNVSYLDLPFEAVK